MVGWYRRPVALPSAEWNRRLVREASAPREAGDSGPLFALTADDVRWKVIVTTAASGVFESKRPLVEGAFAPLLQRLRGELVTRLHDVSADGDKVFLEFETHCSATNGVAYDQEYCWAMRMRGGRIVEIVVYLDTDLRARVLA